MPACFQLNRTTIVLPQVVFVSPVLRDMNFTPEELTRSPIPERFYFEVVLKDSRPIRNFGSDELVTQAERSALIKALNRYYDERHFIRTTERTQCHIPPYEVTEPPDLSGSPLAIDMMQETGSKSKPTP